MKRVLSLLTASVLAALLGILPWKNHDAAELLPVQTLLIDADRGTVILSAENLRGSGANLAAAMEDMAAHAPGELFFGQVSRVIVGQQALALLPEAAVQEQLRLNTAVYQTRGSAAEFAEGLEELDKYLEAQERRGRLTTLLQCCADEKAPIRMEELRWTP